MLVWQVLQKEDVHVLRRALGFEVENQRNKGRSKRTWKKQVEEESVNDVSAGKMNFDNQSSLLELITLQLY